MLRKILLLSLAITLLAIISVESTIKNNEDNKSEETKAVLSEEEESLEAFNTMMDVLTHQRCINCHPSDNVPKQGEDSHPHRFDITRANATAATNCNTCHQKSNNVYSGVPGAPHWSLAPHSMRWEGLSRVEIAESMLDPERNGNRTHEDLLHHLTEHELVMWAWEPGLDLNGEPREIPPVPKDEYKAAVIKWIEGGAVIPKTEN